MALLITPISMARLKLLLRNKKRNNECHSSVGPSDWLVWSVTVVVVVHPGRGSFMSAGAKSASVGLFYEK
jgi:hypothetical protein